MLPLTHLSFPTTIPRASLETSPWVDNPAERITYWLKKETSQGPDALTEGLQSPRQASGSRDTQRNKMWPSLQEAPSLIEAGSPSILWLISKWIKQARSECYGSIGRASQRAGQSRKLFCKRPHWGWDWGWAASKGGQYSLITQALSSDGLGSNSGSVTS